MDAPRRLVVVLGDQLTLSLPSLRRADPDRDIVLMAEVEGEATYVRHHKKKIAFVLSAMRHFALDLVAAGWSVDYIELNSPDNSGSLAGEISRAAQRHGIAHVLVTAPGEWRLKAAFETMSRDRQIEIEILEDDRFLCSGDDFAAWFESRRQPRLEHFYREMRRRTGLLMDGRQPVGGRWNLDGENRNRAPQGTRFVSPKRFEPDHITRDVVRLVDRNFKNHFGTLEPFWFAVTRTEAETALDHFIETRLENFGVYQDAMLQTESFLSHSVISLYLNVGLLDPIETCRKVEAAYRDGRVPLNSAEGFIRQIIGWREYVRGVYWLKMPAYADSNFLAHTRPLPAFYWTGETEMACLRACIDQTKQEAYAHHIQRLMVTGNFAMLAGVEPRQVHEWYLAVYADAFEWVELPNTLGMSQFADGGLLGSKPYAASGNYIKRMSDYCRSCRYNVKEKTGTGACPFNYLYWQFLDRHRDKLGNNPRLRQVYRVWDRMTDAHKRAVRNDADLFLANLDAMRPAHWEAEI